MVATILNTVKLLYIIHSGTKYPSINNENNKQYCFKRTNMEYRYNIHGYYN